MLYECNDTMFFPNIAINNKNIAILKKGDPLSRIYLIFVISLLYLAENVRTYIRAFVFV